MLVIEYLLFIVACAVLNRARGTQFYNLTSSTTLGRLLSMGLISLLTSLFLLPDYILSGEVFLASFAGLMLWCTPAWDAYWSAQIGNDPNHSKLWGCGMMLLRQLLILPTLIAQSYLASHLSTSPWVALSLLYWLPYLIFGAIDKGTVIPRAEYSIGGLIGITILLILRGATLI